MTQSTAPAYTLETQNGRAILVASGDWLVSTIAPLDAGLRQLETGGTPPIVDVSGLGRIDTAGAFLLDRMLRDTCPEGGSPIETQGENAVATTLLQQIRDTAEPCAEPDTAINRGFADVLERTGRGTVGVIKEIGDTLAFLGETVVTCLKLIVQPAKMRWTAMVRVMEQAGLDAIPIVLFLSFFIGIVMAYIGATTLQAFGATIFTPELVGFAILREFGVVITAIILAGRTNSAFTAQIGAMKMRQEVDAMTTLGLKPMEVLVAPRVFAMVIMTPILSFLAVIAGLGGGMLVSWLTLDINPVVFLQRLQTYVPIENFWVGMSKAPIFGLVVAIIACRQGLAVGGSVQSLGEKTTTSVVNAIFAIIVIDAVFAIFYMEMGI